MTIAVGASVSAGNGGAASVTTASRTTQASGSSFSLFVGWYGSGATPTITDSKGNTWTQVGSTLVSTVDANLHSALFEKENGTGGTSHTFTATFGGAQTVISMWVREITGGLTSGIRDQAPAGLEDTSSPYTSNTTGTTAQANELLLAYTVTLSSSGTETITWGNSFASVGDDITDANTLLTGSGASRVVSAVGAYQASLTSAGAGTTGADTWIVTYKDATAGGGGTQPLDTARTSPEPAFQEPLARRLVNVAALVAVAGSSLAQYPDRSPVSLESAPSESLPQRRRPNVPSWGSIPVGQPPPKRIQAVVEPTSIDVPPGIRKRSPESVDDPVFLLWGPFLDDYTPSFERVQSAREFLPVDAAPAVDQPPPERQWQPADTAPTDLRIALLRRLPESVDAPPPERFGTTADTPFNESLPRLLRRLPESFVDTSSPLLARWRAVADTPAEDVVPRLLRRLPESVDQPPPARLHAGFDTPSEDVWIKLPRRAPESVDQPVAGLKRLGTISDTPLTDLQISLRRELPDSVDQPLLSRWRVTSDTPAEEARIRRAFKLPDALVTAVDQPPAPRWRTISDTPATDLRNSRSRWVLPSGAVVIPDQPLARWRTALEPIAEESRIRVLRRLPESVDQPPLILRRIALDNFASETPPRELRRSPESVDQPTPILRWRAPADFGADENRGRSRLIIAQTEDQPLTRWRTPFDAPAVEQLPRLLRRLPESYVPPPVDDPPQRRWLTIADTPFEDLPPRHLRLLLESGAIVGPIFIDHPANYPRVARYPANGRALRTATYVPTRRR